MKRNISLIVGALFALTAAAAAPATAGNDTLVVTTRPQMHCAGCENKIKNKLKFIRGTRKIRTSIPQQTVTVIYDGRKAKAETYAAALREIGYDVQPADKK